MSRPLSEIAFHRIKQDNPDSSIQKALESGQITKQDADLIREYVADSQISRNIGGKRAQKIVLFWSAFEDLSDRSQKIQLLIFTPAYQKLNPKHPSKVSNSLKKQFLITSGCSRLFTAG